MPHGTTTASHASKTNACPSRESLKGYLSGWTDEDDSLRIEDHLTHCGDCEQVITEVENEPESMVLEIESGDTQTPLDSIVSYALSLAKRQPSIPVGLGPVGSGPVGSGPVGLGPDGIGSNRAENGLNPADGAQQSMPSRVPMVASEIGPYELIRSLGHGGMGSVYLARHRELDKLVAIKVFPARWLGNDHHQTRFKREIRAAGGLNHSAIVTATDAGKVDDIHYLVMEFIDGMDLSRTTRLCGPLGIADACETMRRVALGLSHAHAAGIVHRDIKPSNLMLSTSGDVKILDFGLARHSLWDEASAELTTVGQLMGTLDYMAPEQAECAAAVDYRADLYSLGATLFRLLAGRPPLAAAPDLSPLTKLRLLGTTCPPRIDTLRADVPKPLVEFIAMLLHRSPDQRPASAAHVAERLADFSANHNLAALAEQAQQKLSTSPSVDSPSIEPLRRASNPTILNVPVPGSRAGRGGRFWKWLVIAAALPAFIFAGILFLVETQKGQLVIESDAENISIQLLSDGQVYDTVKVVPGATSTRLLAGRYEITIAGAAEDFQIDHESVEIRRGETIIARVRRSDSKADATSDSASTIAPAISAASPLYFSEEWVFEGKSLSVWMEQLAVERSPTELYKAIDAIKALTGSANAEEVVNALYATLKTVENQKISTESRNSTVDYEVFRILVEAAETPAAFYDRLVQELKTADTQWAKRLFAGASRGDETASSALVDWIVTGELGSDRDPERVESAADFVRIYLFNIKVDQAETERLVDALFASQRLGDEFWLEVVPDDSSPDRFPGYENIPILFLKAMRLKAIEAFTAEDADPVAVAKAAIILRRLADPMYAASLPITDQQQQTVFDAIDKRMSAMAVSKETLAANTTLERQYFLATVPSTLSLSFFPIRFNNVSIDRSPSRPVSNAIVLLNLAKSIQRPGQYLSASENICRELEGIITKDYRPEEIAVRSGILWKDFAISWPLPTNSNAALEPQLAFLIYAGAFETLSAPQKEVCKQRFLSTMYDITSQSDFQKRDADQNGSLTDVELEDFSDWKTYDTNGDGEISGNEHRAMTEKKLSEIEANGVPTNMDPKYLAYAERIIARSDKDGDGVLSGKERKDMIMDISAADMNLDGFITVAKYAVYLQKRTGGR